MRSAYTSNDATNTKKGPAMTIEFKDYEQGLNPFIVHCAYANCDMTVDTS